MALNIQKGVLLSRHTTFNVGGRAKFFAEVGSVDELRQVLGFAEKNNLKTLILGGGSNTVFLDGKIDKLIIKIKIKGIKFRDDLGRVFVSAGAGEEWDKIVAESVKKELWGLENLSLIPGTVGGAVYQNIGAYGVELKDVLNKVIILNSETGSVLELRNGDCCFGYRKSLFQDNQYQNYVIIGAELKLLSEPKRKLDYPDLIKQFVDKKPAVAEIRNAIIKIRKSKLQYPNSKIGTAGSFFKNPVVTNGEYKKLIAKNPDIKGRPSEDGKSVKLSAAQLIEKAGWKGKRVGDVGVSAKHALVLVSYQGGSSRDLIHLADSIKASVKKNFDVNLEPEVNIIF